MDVYTIVILIATTSSFSFVSVRGEFKLQILHTNDMHARFAEIDEFTSTCSQVAVKEDRCYGGFARIKKVADRMREEATAKNVSTIFLNAGDTFQGTPYYSIYKWKIVASLINTLGFDAMCLGNHEFDDGIDNLVYYLKHVKIPTVTCNLNRTSEKRLDKKLVKNSIVMDIKGHKIGIIGYLTPETMVISSTENLQIFDEISYLKAEAKDLKSKGVNFIIGLGHSGLERDKEIAKEVEELDMIVGGHSHSLLYSPKDKPPSRETVEESYPYWVTQKSGKRVPIVQSFAYTKYFGSLTLTLDEKYKVVAAEGNSHLLDHSYEKDSAVEKKVDGWTSKIRRKLSKVIGKTRVSLTKSTFENDKFESNFANLINDAIFDKVLLQAKMNNFTQWAEHAIVLYQHGGIRVTFDAYRNEGNLTVEDILTALPFQNTVYQCRLSGKNIKEILEWSVIRFSPRQRYLAYFLYFGGLRVVYDLRQPPAARVKNVMVICTKCSVPQYEELKDDETYLIILTSFLLQGGDNFSTFKSCADVKPLGFIDADAVMEYIQKQKIIYPILDGRLRVFENDKPSMANKKQWSLYNLLLIFLICIKAAS